MMEVAKRGGPCGGKAPPPPPPCPKPPPPPFNWIYLLVTALVMAVLSTLYKYWAYVESMKKAGLWTRKWAPRPIYKRPPHYLDLPPCVQYLIIGTGPAGWGAYKGIRDHDPDAKVFFLSKDDVFPYSRGPISKYMWWNGLPPDLKTLNYISDLKLKTMYYTDCEDFMDPMDWYWADGPATSIGLGWCVTKVDADEHKAFIATPCGDVPIYYDRCLLAPGSIAKNLKVFARAPKFVREHTIALREIRDLEIAYRKVVDAKHVTIVGAGPLGCELAYYMGRMQVHWFPPPDDEYEQPEILLISKDKAVMGGVLPDYLGEWLQERIKCEHVQVMNNAQVYDAFETPDGKLELTLSNGTSVKTDYVLVAMGAEPNLTMAEGSFLETDPVNGGLVVNTEFLARTHLYIAGDAASYYSQWKDTRMRLEHEWNAEHQGYAAGTNMTGYWLPCNDEPHWWFNLGEDIDAQVVGEVGGCMPTVGLFKPCNLLMHEDPKIFEMDERRGDFQKPCYKDSMDYRYRYKRGMLFYLRDETVVGIVFWNFTPMIPQRLEVATEILRAQPSYKQINVIAELLGFPAMICVGEVPSVAKASDLPQGPCITEKADKWLQYEDTQSQFGILSVPEGEKQFFYKTKEQLIDEEQEQDEVDRIAKAAIQREQMESFE